IMTAPWPVSAKDKINDLIEEKMNLIMGVIKSIRNIRNEMKVNPGKRIKAILNSPEEKKSILNEGYEYIRNLAGLSELIIEVDLQEKPAKVSTAVSGGVEIILPLEGMIDIDKEIERLEKELAEVESEIKRAEGKLANEGFVKKAPAELVEKEREKLLAYQEKKKILQQHLEELK
ncbi:MAG: class I tRNA ligase family protein, partial [Halanaerobiales bacterium]